MTDFARWTNFGSLKSGWGKRAKVVARMIPRGARVLDIGCGRMDLERYLRGGHYQPADLAARDSRTKIIDLNKEALTPGFLGDCDTVTMLGVIEYLDDPAPHLAVIARAGRRFVCTYWPPDFTAEIDRKTNGWVNAFTTAGFTTMLETAGFALRELAVFEERQLVMRWEPVATARGG